MLTRCLLFFILCFTVTINIAQDAEELHCPSIERHEIERHLSTKTPYRVIANNEDKPFEYPGCKATRIWSVIRHGARNPSKKVIMKAQKELIELKKRILENKRTLLCSKELEELKYWNFNVSVEEEKHLVAEGEDELIELAERMQNRFPDILPDTYDSDVYYFKYTATQRTLESANSFATGLFGRHRLRDIVYPEALHRDPVLRVHGGEEQIAARKTCDGSKAYYCKWYLCQSLCSKEVLRID